MRQWIISARQQFDIAQQLSQSHEDLLRKQQLLKVDTSFSGLFVSLFYLFICFACSLALLRKCHFIRYPVIIPVTSIWHPLIIAVITKY